MSAWAPARIAIVRKGTEDIEVDDTEVSHNIYICGYLCSVMCVSLEQAQSLHERLGKVLERTKGGQ